MDWFTLALLSTGMFAAAGLLDKFMLDGHITDSRSYVICQVAAQMIFTAPVFISGGCQFVYPDSLYAIATGGMQIIPSVYYLRAMQTEEVSRVTAIENLYPLLVFIGASAFLGEALTLRHYIGGLVLILGIVLMSYHGGLSGISPAIRPFCVYWTLTAIYYLALECLLSSMSEWDLYSWSSIGSLLAAMPMLAGRDVRAETIGFFKKGFFAVGALAVEETFQFLGMLFSIFAYSAGSVSLVTAVGALQPFITLISVVFLNIFRPGIIDEELNAKILIQKFAASLLVSLGLYFIY